MLGARFSAFDGKRAFVSIAARQLLRMTGGGFKEPLWIDPLASLHVFPRLFRILQQDVKAQHKNPHWEKYENPARIRAAKQQQNR